MKISNKMLELLMNNGLFRREAEEIIERYISSVEAKPMVRRMSDDESNYPPQVITTVWLGIQHHALEWIDENVPEHWARPTFAREV